MTLSGFLYEEIHLPYKGIAQESKDIKCAYLRDSIDANIAT